MEESPHHFRVFRVALVGIQKSKHFQKQTDISPKSGKNHWTCPIFWESQRNTPDSHDDKSANARNLL